MNVVEFGDEVPLVQKAGIVLSSGKGMPDIFTAGYRIVPSYEDPIFSKVDPYFNQTIGTIFGDIIVDIPDVEVPTSDSYTSATAGAYEIVFTEPEDIDIQSVLDATAEQIKNITGRTIAE